MENNKSILRIIDSISRVQDFAWPIILVWVRNQSLGLNLCENQSIDRPPYDWLSHSRSINKRRLKKWRSNYPKKPTDANDGAVPVCRVQNDAPAPRAWKKTNSPRPSMVRRTCRSCRHPEAASESFPWSVPDRSAHTPPCAAIGVSKECSMIRPIYGWYLLLSNALTRILAVEYFKINRSGAGNMLWPIKA